jgi:large conductance mechanosensitive channel
MPIVRDFKKFAMRGNMIDLAIGFTVGAAFTSVVRSLVDDVIMPPLGLLIGNSDLSDNFWVLSVPETATEPPSGFLSLEAAKAAGATTINYGLFLNSILTLFIVALAMFILIRLVNRMDETLDQAFGQTQPPPGEPTEKKCDFCRLPIPYRASRCPQCTSELPEIPEKSAAAAV